MPKPVTIAGIAYPSMKSAIKNARRILDAGTPGSRVSGDGDTAFLEGLFFSRVDKVTNLHGLNVIHYERDWQDKTIAMANWTMCFWAVLENGERVDFSFMKTIKQLAN